LRHIKEIPAQGRESAVSHGQRKLVSFPRWREFPAFPSRDPRLREDDVITNSPKASGLPDKIALIKFNVKLAITPLSI